MKLKFDSVKFLDQNTFLEKVHVTKSTKSLTNFICQKISPMQVWTSYHVKKFVTSM